MMELLATIVSIGCYIFSAVVIGIGIAIYRKLTSRAATTLVSSLPDTSPKLRIIKEEQGNTIFYFIQEEGPYCWRTLKCCSNYKQADYFFREYSSPKITTVLKES